MAKRKVSKQDVDQAYDIAKEAKKNALFSLRRARQLKDGADKLRKEYKEGQEPPKKKKDKAAAKAKSATKEAKTADEKKQAKRAYWAKRKAIEKNRTESAPKSEPQE